MADNLARPDLVAVSWAAMDRSSLRMLSMTTLPAVQDTAPDLSANEFEA
jgi:hypothetical protein